MLLRLDGGGGNPSSSGRANISRTDHGDYFRSKFDLQLSQTRAEWVFFFLGGGFTQNWPELFPLIRAGGLAAESRVSSAWFERHGSVMCLSVSLSSLQRGNLVTSWLDNLTQRAGKRMKGGGEGTEERGDGNAAY